MKWLSYMLTKLIVVLLCFERIVNVAAVQRIDVLHLLLDRNY